MPQTSDRKRCGSKMLDLSAQHRGSGLPNSFLKIALRFRGHVRQNLFSQELIQFRSIGKHIADFQRMTKPSFGSLQTFSDMIRHFGHNAGVSIHAQTFPTCKQMCSL